MAALQPGLQLAGRYTLERRLGNGGMAEVWSAVDGKRRERVAIKALHAGLAAQPAMIELLRNEYRNVRKLDHPHVLRALAFYDESDPPFLVFELAEDGDFRRYVGASPGEFLPRLLPVVDALAAAHANGIVHRDLKLANILTDARGEARLADFGIAAVLDGDGLALRTGGTPATMSPQQLAREPATPADDLYALGLVLYELLAGAPPPAGASVDEITATLRTKLNEAARVPGDLMQLVAELLAPDPASRPASMQAVHARLEQALAASVTTIPPELVEIESAGPARFEQVALVSPRLARASESAQEKRAPPLAFRVRFAIAGALALVTAVMLFTWLPRTLPKPPPVASTPAPPAKPASSLEIPGPAPFELAKLARAREEAKTLVDRVVELQGQAEERGALEWAAQDYADATARAQTGDELFKGQDYDGARAAYQEAAQALDSVLGRADSVLS
jgi:serine/threonine-protein kinase